MDQHKEQEQEQEQEGGTMDQHKEQEQEGEPADQRKEEKTEAGNPDEEPTDQRKEEEEPEVDKSEELTDQRKAEAEEEKETETERSTDEDSMEASSLFVHPCSLLLRYLVRAYAWCLGLADSFGGGTRPSAAPAASTNSSREEAGEAADMRTREISKTTTDRGFYMREVIMRVRRPRPPGNPREGRGGGHN